MVGAHDEAKLLSSWPQGKREEDEVRVLQSPLRAQPKTLRTHY
jgi:hypothetical protein